MYGLLADAVVVLHLLFIVFVAFGGLLGFKWLRVVWLHLPALVWGAAAEFFGLICPLTPLENHLRRLGNEAGYSGDFIANYLVPIVYPAALTREIQWLLGALLILFNLVVYVLVVWRKVRLIPESGGCREKTGGPDAVV